MCLHVFQILQEPEFGRSDYTTDALAKGNMYLHSLPNKTYQQILVNDSAKLRVTLGVLGLHAPEIASTSSQLQKRHVAVEIDVGRLSQLCGQGTFSAILHAPHLYHPVVAKMVFITSHT